jgi:hypothetical protein
VSFFGESWNICGILPEFRSRSEWYLSGTIIAPNFFATVREAGSDAFYLVGMTSIYNCLQQVGQRRFLTTMADKCARSLRAVAFIVIFVIVFIFVDIVIIDRRHLQAQLRRDQPSPVLLSVHFFPPF